MRKAPVSENKVTAPATALALTDEAAVIFTSKSLADIMLVVEIPSNITIAIVVAPLNNPVPEIVTTVPCWPKEGVTDTMEPYGTYANPLTLTTRAPVFAIKMTSPCIKKLVSEKIALTITIELF